jgi:hypothetical protein
LIDDWTQRIVRQLILTIFLVIVALVAIDRVSSSLTEPHGVVLAGFILIGRGFAQITDWSPERWTASATIVLALSTCFLAIATRRQIFFLTRADKTARLAAEATIAQMRAYVSVVSAKIYGFDQDGESRVLIRIGNTGDTVAFDVTGEYGVTIQNAEIFNFKGDLRPKDHGPISRSRAGMGPKTTFDSFNVIPTLTPDLKAAIRAGTLGIFAYGEIRYKDALKNPRRTTYRLMYGGAVGADPNGLLVTCEEGNDSD